MKEKIKAILDNKSVKAALVLVAAAFFIGFSYSCIRKSIEITDSYVFYRAGRAIIEGEPLYDRDQWRAFSNPPFLAIFMVPFSMMGLVGFSVVWYFFNVGLLVGTLFLSIYLATGKMRPTMPLVLFPLLMTLRPIESNLTLGQCNMLVIFFTVAGLALMKKGWPVLGGISIASAVWIKLTPGLFLPYFLYKKQWKMAAGILVGMVLFAFVLPAFFFGPGGAVSKLLTWWQFTSANRLGMADGQYVPGQTLRSFLMRLLADSSITGDPPFKYINVATFEPHIVQYIVYGVSGLMLGVMAWSFRGRNDQRTSLAPAIEFALVALTMTMISPFSRKAHYVSMILPAVVLAEYWLRCARERKPDFAPKALIALTIFLVTGTSSDLVGNTASIYLDGVGTVFLAAFFMWVGLNVFLMRERGSAREEKPPAPENLANAHDITSHK